MHHDSLNMVLDLDLSVTITVSVQLMFSQFDAYPLLTPSLMAFHESSHFVIQESQFTNIQGSQYNYIQGHLVQYPQPAKQESKIRDEVRIPLPSDCTADEQLGQYIAIPRGKIYIKKTLGVTYLGGYDPKTGCWRNLDAYRTINIARIHGEDKDSEFLHLVYSGSDAFTVNLFAFMIMGDRTFVLIIIHVGIRGGF
jgi:hypothetical protein